MCFFLPHTEQESSLQTAVWVAVVKQQFSSVNASTEEVYRKVTKALKVLSFIFVSPNRAPGAATVFGVALQNIAYICITWDSYMK